MSSRRRHPRCFAAFAIGLLALQALLFLHLTIDPHMIRLSDGRLVHVHGPAVPAPPDGDHPGDDDPGDEECPVVGLLDAPRLVVAPCPLIVERAPSPRPAVESDRTSGPVPLWAIYLLAPSTSPPSAG